MNGILPRMSGLICFQNILEVVVRSSCSNRLLQNSVVVLSYSYSFSSGCCSSVSSPSASSVKRSNASSVFSTVYSKSSYVTKFTCTLMQQHDSVLVSHLEQSVFSAAQEEAERTDSVVSFYVTNNNLHLRKRGVQLLNDVVQDFKLQQLQVQLKCS